MIHQTNLNPDQTQDRTQSETAEKKQEGIVRITRSLRPDAASFEYIKEALLSEFGNNEETRNIILACEELFINIVNYSGADNVDFTYTKAGEDLTVIFSDNGIPFDPADADVGEKEFEELDRGGMGIMFAHMLSEEMKYSRADGRNILTLRFRV